MIAHPADSRLLEVPRSRHTVLGRVMRNIGCERQTRKESVQQRMPPVWPEQAGRLKQTCTLMHDTDV